MHASRQRFQRALKCEIGHKQYWTKRDHEVDHHAKKTSNRFTLNQRFLCTPFLESSSGLREPIVTILGISRGSVRTRMLNSPTPKRTRPVSDASRCLCFRMFMIWIQNEVRYCLRETVFATIFLRLCSILCDMIAQPCKCFSTGGAVHVVLTSRIYFSPISPGGRKTVCPIASATLTRASMPVSV